MDNTVNIDANGIARDGSGNIVYPTIINMICPIAYEVQARSIIDSYIEIVEQIVIKNSPFIKLGPQNSNEITHIGATKSTYSNRFASHVAFLANQNLKWVAKRAYTLSDDPNIIKSLLCCVTGNTADALEYLQLAPK